VELAMFLSGQAVKPARTTMVLVIGLALMSNGCTSMYSTAPPTVTLTSTAADKETWGAQQQTQEEPKKEFASQKDPVEQSFYIINGLTELGCFLAGGK